MSQIKPNFINIPIGKGEFGRSNKHFGIAICPVCGFAYLSIDESLSCKYCADKRARLRHRANKFNATVDASITLLSVYNKSDGICNDCKTLLPHPRYNMANPSYNQPSIEHIIPLSEGGNHTFDNVELLCHSCNNIRNEKKQGKK